MRTSWQKTTTSIRSAFVIIALSSLLLSGTPGFSQQEPPKVLLYKKFRRPAPISIEHLDQYYLRFVAEYAHFRQEHNDRFWNRLRAIFTDSDRHVVVTAAGGFTAGTERIESSTLLLSLEPRQERFESYVAYGKALMPAVRLQPSTTVSLIVSVKDTGVDRPSALFKAMSQIESIPLVNSLTAGYVGLAGSVVDSITEAAGNGNDSALTARIDFNDIQDLVRTEYIAVYSAYDRGAFHELGDGVPRSASQLGAADLTKMPSLILFKVDVRDRLLTPDLLMNKTFSSVSAPLEDHLNSLKSMTGEAANRDRVNYCVCSLRPFLQNTLNLNRADSGMAAVIVMAQGGYDPDKSNYHRNIPGCYTDAELESVRRECPDCPLGSCSSNKCKAAMEFLLRWFNGQSVDNVIVPGFRVTNELGGGFSQEKLTSSEFFDTFALRRKFGDYKDILGGRAGEASGVVIVKGTSQRFDANITFGFADGWACETRLPGNDCLITQIDFTE